MNTLIIPVLAYLSEKAREHLHRLDLKVQGEENASCVKLSFFLSVESDSSPRDTAPQWLPWSSIQGGKTHTGGGQSPSDLALAFLIRLCIGVHSVCMLNILCFHLELFYCVL